MSFVTDEASPEFRQLCKDYYNGDLDALYQDYKDRYVDSAATIVLKKIDFNFENETAKVIDQRVNGMPTEYRLNAPEGKEKQKEFWKKYFEGEYFHHKPLLQLINDIYYDMEKGGAAILVGYPNPEDPKSPIWLKHTNVEYEPVTDPENIFSIIAYRFKLHRAKIDKNGNKTDVIVEIEVTKERQTTTVGGEVQEASTIELNVQDAKGKTILPVVVFPREDLDGVYYRPGIAALRNGALNLNQGLVKRAESTKRDSFGNWCPELEEHAGIGFGSDAAGNNKQWNLRPGSYIPFPIKKVGGATEIASIEKEIVEARESIRALGLFVDSSDTTRSNQGESGTAKRIGTKGMRGYIESILPKVTRSLNRLLEISSYINGEDAEDIKFIAPPAERADPDTVAAKSERLHDWGYEEEALRNEGYDEDKIKTLMAERKAAEKEDTDDATDRANKEANGVG